MKPGAVHLFFCVGSCLGLILLAVGISGAAGGRATTVNTVGRVLYATRPPSENAGHGTLGGLQKVPLLSYNAPPAGAGFVEGWGAVYADTSNVYPANVRVAVKNFETYVWSNSQDQWVRLQAVKTPGGALFKYNFTSHTPGNKRVEPDGSLSVSLRDTYLFHFFPTAHAAIDPSDVGGVFTTYDARLIKDVASGPDNINATRWVADAGGDFYARGTYPFNGKNTVAVGGGKYIYLTRHWKALNFYTGGPPSVINGPGTKFPAQAWTEGRLQANPPPMDGMGAP